MTIEFRKKIICFSSDTYTCWLTNCSLLFVKAGQAYFISDGAPINTYEFFRPLVSKYFYIPTGIISISILPICKFRTG